MEQPEQQPEQPEQPEQQPDEKVETVPLDMDDEPGDDTVIRQENVGRDNMEGGGEWPDPDTPPRGPSPG